MSETDQDPIPRVRRRGLLLVLSSPSGAGKTTLARRLLAADPLLRLSVSLTTRKPRRGEMNGRDYTFVTPAEFERLKTADELLEWAEVHGNCYATPRAPVRAAVDAGEDVLFDVDWQGARQLKQQLPRDVVSIFILPPNGRALERRLKVRNQDSDEVMARRLAAAAAEIEHWVEYDYVMINSDLDASFSALSSIATAERLRRERQSGLDSFVQQVLTTF